MKNWIIICLLAALVVKSGIFVGGIFTVWYGSLVISTLLVWSLDFKVQELKERRRDAEND